MRRILILGLLVLCVLALPLVAACGGGEETETTAEPTETTAAPTETTAAPTETTAATGETIKLTWAEMNPPNIPTAVGTQAYADHIVEASGGRVEIDVHGGGSLYGNTEVFDGVRMGGADAGSYVIESGDGFHYNILFNLPFINYPGMKEAVEIYWTLYEEFPQFEQEFTDLGLAYTAHYQNPPVHLHFHEANKVVRTPEDIKGMSLLALEGYMAEWFSLLGAAPENPSYNDLFSMIDTKAADGFIQHCLFMAGFDLVKQFKSHTILGTGGANMMGLGMLWNKDTLNGLPADIQQLILDSGREVYLDAILEANAGDVEKWETAIAESGNLVTTLTPEEIKPWQDVLQPVYQSWIDGAPDPAVAQSMFDRLMELTGN